MDLGIVRYLNKMLGERMLEEGCLSKKQSMSKTRCCSFWLLILEPYSTYFFFCQCVVRKAVPFICEPMGIFMDSWET